MESFIRFFEKCRLCLENAGGFNIFEKEDFPTQIFLCTGVKVHPSDNLPQKICKNCMKIVKSATELREIASKNNTHLKTLFQLADSDEDTKDNKTDETHYSQQAKRRKQHYESEPTTSNEKISVRTDLFETTSKVTSSMRKEITNNQKPILDDITSCRKIRIDNDTVHYECSICFKTYDKRKKLYLHQRCHNKNVMCPLDVCGKVFSTKADMEKHFRTHTGEKPYACNLCNKRFTQKVTLKSHQEAVHEK